MRMAHTHVFAEMSLTLAPYQRQGTHSWKDGRRVNGQWKGGHLNGRVIFSWPNGACFDGQCRMGKKHGRGE
jgi:hypothetical protein